MNVWLMIAVGWFVMALVMAGLWAIQRRTDNAGIVDIGWTFGVGALAIFFCVATLEGDPARRTMIAVLAGLWSLRLGGHLVLRVSREPEDGRYRDLKSRWGEHAQGKMFWFFQFQAIGCALFALPMLAAAQVTEPLGVYDYLGVVIWLVALGGEAVADRQLARFRADPSNRGKVCQVGWWRYSRHPNYFFEWLHWWSYVFLAIAHPWGWLTIAAPLAMLYLFVFVTGIPPTEAQSIRSRGDAYRAYQATTSPFFPWPPRRLPPSPLKEAS